jgi:hypothetical protein
VAVAAAISPTAAAAQSQDPDLSSVAQYSESVPSSTGRTGSGVATLPPGILGVIRLQGGRDAALLEAIATEARYGAPVDVARTSSSRGASPSAPAAALSAVTDGDSPDIVRLLVVLVATTTGALVVVLMRARRGRTA